MSQPGDDLNELDRQLQAIRFEPRASLGAEIAGRARREEPRPPTRANAVRRILAIAGVVTVTAVGSILWRVTAGTHGVSAVDRCCQDLDGGGAADDGLLVVARRGSEVRRLAIYEDRDGTRSFTPGDALRFDRRGRPTIAMPLLAGERTMEFCCVDYDGGGRSDDALMVVGLPPDRITMAAIYEREGPPGVPMPLR
jgi:hypothetical protein